MAAWVGAVRGQELTILRHEPLPSPIPNEAADVGNSKPQARAADLSFVAFGRRFDVELEPNDALLSALPAEQIAMLADLELYQGQLAGIPGSWVRLSRHRGALSGMIWDGAELYGIDEYRRIAPLLLSPADGDVAGSVIYRWSETVGALSDAVEELIDVKPSDRATPSSVESAAFATGIRPGKQLDIGLIADVEYAAREGTAAQAALLSVLNIVDGIFIKQVGVRINAASLKIFEAEADPFSSLDGSLLLDELESYKDTTAEIRSLGAAHLFTGRDLNEPTGSNGQRVGVANVGQLCSTRLSTSLSQATLGTATNAVIFAHELGHVFGAQHDSSAGACAAGYIMASSIGGSQEFSSCSVEQMLPVLAKATCLSDLPAVDVSLRSTVAPPAVVGQDELVLVGMRIVNTSAQPAIGVELTAFGPSFSSFSLGGISVNGGSCFFEPFRCVWPYVGANQSLTAELRFRGQQPGVGPIDITVSSLNETNTDNDRLHFEIEVLPKVDLMVAVDPAGLSLHPGEAGTMHVTITNRGAMQATNVRALLQVRQSTEIIDFGLGPCVWNGNTYLYGYDCAVGDLPPDAMKRFDVVVRARNGLTQAEMDFGGWLDVTASAREPDSNGTNNRASSRLTLGTSIADLGLTIQSPSQLTIDQRFEIELKVRNNGPDTAEAIEIQQYQSGVPLSRSFTEITTTLGVCTMQPPANDFFCSVPQLPTGQELTIKFVGTTAVVGNYSLGIQSWMRSSDRESSNNSASLLVRAVAPSPSPSPSATSPAATSAPSDGGGGAADIATVLALGLGWWLRRGRTRGPTLRSAFSLRARALPLRTVPRRSSIRARFPFR